jgi:hypothetical protein
MQESEKLVPAEQAREQSVKNQFEIDPAVMARRRLIKGAFGAPAALTLVSGSAYAASNQRCLQNVNAMTPPPEAPTPATDTWLRVELWTLGSGGNVSTWVCGADLAPLRAPDTNAPYLSSGSWQAVTAGTGSGFTAGQILPDAKTAAPPKTPSGATPVRSGQYVAVRVDSVGNIVGVQGVNTAGGAAVSRVCWASVVGVR